MNSFRHGGPVTIPFCGLALLLAVLMAGCGGNSTLSSAPSVQKATAATPGSYIVVMKPGSSAAAASNLAVGLANRPVRSYRTVFNGFAGTLTAAEHARLAADPAVLYIEPDRQLSICAPKKPKPDPTPDPDPAPPQEIPAGIDDTDAERNTGPRGLGVAVAVLDTGIDYDHPDLGDAVLGGVNLVNTRKDYDDDNGHGTHVSGIIAARDNEIGVLGMAPKASLVAVKVLGRTGSGDLSTIIAGIQWVADHQNTFSDPIKVVNMSLGGPGFSQALYDAIDAVTDSCGITFVVAAGNEDDDASNYSPAGFDNVICVSALWGFTQPDRGEYGVFATFSNWGSAVDLTADGMHVLSLYKNGGYESMHGTSMACPHVAGAAALYLDDHLSAGFAEVLAVLLEEGFPAPPSPDWPDGGWWLDPDGIAEPQVYAKDL